MTVGLQRFAERVGDGLGHPRLDADAGEELVHVQPGVAVAIGRRQPESPGTLYISNRKVVWLSDADLREGYAVDFFSISLHAVSRDPEAYPLPCIYAQIEVEESDEDEESEGSDAEGGDDSDLLRVTEMRLVPSDPNQLDALFDVFCKCAELNPDLTQEDDDEENVWIFGDEDTPDDGDESELFANPIGWVNGNHAPSQTVLEMQINDLRFDDADADEMEEPQHHRPPGSEQH